MTVAIDVVDETERAQVLLHRPRLDLLEQLAEPSSAARLARTLGLPRQRVNYHLRELESQRLIELVEERRKGSVSERIYRRTGDGYVISNSALGGVGALPESVQDRFSAEYLIALCARGVSELGRLQAGATAEKKRLATFSLDVEVRFASPQTRSAFADELTATVAALVKKYHDDAAPEGRTHRFCVGAWPRPLDAHSMVEKGSEL